MNEKKSKLTCSRCAENIARISPSGRKGEFKLECDGCEQAIARPGLDKVRSKDGY